MTFVNKQVFITSIINQPFLKYIACDNITLNWNGLKLLWNDVYCEKCRYLIKYLITDILRMLGMAKVLLQYTLISQTEEW